MLSHVVPHKLLKFNYKQIPWTIPKISSFLRKRTKLTKQFCKKSIGFIIRTTYE